MADSKHQHYLPTINAVFKKRKADTLAIVPQCLYEFVAVATRSPSNSGLGMDNPRANRWIARYRVMFELLPDPVDLLDRWQEVVAKYQVKGFQVHDARYVAAMQCAGITTLMTHNGDHFKKFPVTLVDPTTV